MVFVIDGAEWTLDLREGQGSLSKGPPPEKADITLTISGGPALPAALPVGRAGPPLLGRPAREAESEGAAAWRWQCCVTILIYLCLLHRPAPALPADDNFVKLVMGKLGPQPAFLMRKLKIQGSMGWVGPAGWAQELSRQTGLAPAHPVAWSCQLLLIFGPRAVGLAPRAVDCEVGGEPVFA